MICPVCSIFLHKYPWIILYNAVVAYCVSQVILLQKYNWFILYKAVVAYYVSQAICLCSRFHGSQPSKGKLAAIYHDL